MPGPELCLAGHTIEAAGLGEDLNVMTAHGKPDFDTRQTRAWYTSGCCRHCILYWLLTGHIWYIIEATAGLGDDFNVMTG